MHPTPHNAATQPRLDVDIRPSYVHLRIASPGPALERGDTPSGTVPNVAPKLPCMQDVSNVTHDAVAILELYVVIIREGVIMALR
jgi:hypothetical protein